MERRKTFEKISQNFVFFGKRERKKGLKILVWKKSNFLEIGNGRITYEENSRGNQLTQFESHAPHPLNQERPRDEKYSQTHMTHTLYIYIHTWHIHIYTHLTYTYGHTWHIHIYTHMAYIHTWHICTYIYTLNIYTHMTYTHMHKWHIHGKTHKGPI